MTVLCRDCIHWNKGAGTIHNGCDNPRLTYDADEFFDHDEQLELDGMHIDTDDEHCYALTGPRFGCVHGEER